MNQAEKKAARLYKENKVLADWTDNIMALSKIAKQQDRFYLVIHRRADKK